MTTEARQATCEERIGVELADTMDTLRKLWNLYTGEMEPDEDDPDGFTSEDAIYEYGLSFDYVTPETFNEQPEGYWRYQLSWGGPSDEFRFFSSGPDCTPYRVEYWFLDWWDGAHRNLTGDNLATALDYWQWFADVDSTGETYRRAMEDR